MINPFEQCVICGGTEMTKEHIVPAWLQTYFSLKNQKLGLSNNTTIPYGKTLIPLCEECNTKKLNRLENRIKCETATYTDYYLWTLKIRFLLSIKDTTLQIDIKDSSKGKILSSKQGLIGQEFIRFVLQNFEDSDFCFEPNPFGSVFLFDNPIKDETFGLVDVANPYWGLSISLPNSKILAVLFTDRGIVRKVLEVKYKTKEGLEKWVNKIPVETTNDLIKFIMAKLLITQYQIKNIPYEFCTIDKKILSKPIPDKIICKDVSDLRKETVVDISKNVGLGTKYGKDFYDSILYAS